MPRLVPLYLECIRTGSEGLTEEPYLCIYLNEERVMVWEPRNMQSGDTEDLDIPYTLEGWQIGIILREDDPADGQTKYDDNLGGIQVRGPWPGNPGELSYYPDRPRMSDTSDLLGMSRTEELRELDLTRCNRSLYSGLHYITLPNHEGSYDHDERRYRLYFYLFSYREDPYLQQPYCLELISLECENAQEWKDYPYIKVNGRKVWGPYRMRDVGGDNNFRRIDINQIIIYEVTSVMLWEQDTSSRDDLFGEFEIRIGSEFDFTREHQHTFTYSSKGTARYTLTYRVRHRVGPDIDGNYWECPDT